MCAIKLNNLHNQSTNCINQKCIFDLCTRKIVRDSKRNSVFTKVVLVQQFSASSIGTWQLWMYLMRVSKISVPNIPNILFNFFPCLNSKKVIVVWLIRILWCDASTKLAWLFNSSLCHCNVYLDCVLRTLCGFLLRQTKIMW